MTYRMSLAGWNKLEDCLREADVVYTFPSSRRDGFMYLYGNQDGLAKYHIHSFEHVDEDDMVFDNLLTKSGNWRDGAEPDLAVYWTEDWLRVCAGMDSSVIAVVKALQACFATLGAEGPL